MYIKINTATEDQKAEAWGLSKSHGNFKQKNIPTSILSMAQAGKCLSSVLAILV